MTTTVEVISTFDGNVFPISGTAQPVDHFKINYADYRFTFYRPEGDLQTSLVYEYIRPDMTFINVREMTLTVPKSVTTQANLVDWLLDHPELGFLDPLTGRRSDPYFEPVINVPENLVPADLPAGSVDDSYWEVPGRSDARRLGLNLLDRDIQWGINGNDKFLIRPIAPEFVSLYMETGSTTENEWWIGDILTSDNPKIGHISPELTRSEEWFPISRASDFNVIPRDEKGNRIKNLSKDVSQLRLNLSFTHG